MIDQTAAGIADQPLCRIMFGTFVGQCVVEDVVGHEIITAAYATAAIKATAPRQGMVQVFDMNAVGWMFGPRHRGNLMRGS